MAVCVDNVTVGSVTETCGSAKELCKKYKTKSSAGLSCGSMIDTRIKIAKNGGLRELCLG